MNIAFENEAPYFTDAKLVLICEKLFMQDIDESSFLDKTLIEKWYANKDFHTMYIAKIDKVLIKK